MKSNHSAEIADHIFSLKHLVHKAFGKPFQFDSIITPVAFYIMHQLKNKQPLSMSELSRELGIPKPNITVLADKLIEKKFAERIHDKDDRRLVMIKLTKKGFDFIESTQKNYQEQIKNKLQSLSEKELNHFADALQVVKDTLTTLKSNE
jgi:MarR family 2-MHQ and catechol resistance regulon transcriptional repressor